MKRLSVKAKITLWLTILMLFLCGILITFLLISSGMIIRQASANQLTQTLRSNLTLVSSSDGQLVLDDSFQFYKSGVTTLVYSSSGSLLAGQIPLSFDTSGPESASFQNGEIRTAESNGDIYLILDFWVPFSWNDGVWLRGLIETPEQLKAASGMLIAVIIAIPAFLTLAVLGGYLIVRKAFRPLDKITAAASAINEAGDLSGRIALPPGRDEFSQLAETFDKMFARLERSFDAEIRFIADASHELRTPVSVIQSACEYAESFDETPQERQETISIIHRQAVKMSDLITRLLNMARLDQGTESLNFKTVNLTEISASVCQDYKNYGSRLSTYLQENVMVRGDSVQLWRLLNNLISNAFQYGGHDCRVRVSLYQNSRETLLSVCDDGIGIAKEEQDKVWQRFYQIDPSRSNNKGAGLGLSMVQQVARIHGGYMTLESEPGSGSNFTFHLPLSEKK